MFYDQMKILDCDLCEYGFMIYDEQATIDSYAESHVFQSKDLNKVIEKLSMNIWFLDVLAVGIRKNIHIKK